MPQPAVAGPLGEFDFGDELRLDPRDAAALAAGRRILERRRVDAAFLQLGRQLAQRLRRESGAHAAGVDQVRRCRSSPSSRAPKPTREPSGFV